MEIIQEKAKIIDFKPFEYQKKAISETIKYFSKKENERGKVIMPCGSGKSLTSLWILEQLTDIKRTIIIVPNLILQAQMLGTFYQKFSKTKNFICIGSDEDVKDGIEEDILQVTTYSKHIESFLHEKQYESIIIIATYQSLDILSKASQKLNYEFDFAIIDEAHRTVGHEDKMFSTILFDDKINIKKRLFMTATEKIYNGKEDQIIGMENESFYGKTIYEYALPLAIKENILCDYRVATIFSTSEEIISFIKSNPYLDYENLELDESEKENMMCALLATIKAIREKGCKKIITYHSTIKKAKIFKEFMDKLISNSLLNIATFHINGKQPSKDRFNSMDNFKECFVGVLTNSQALVEGVDIPCVDCIVFADKRESPIAITQAIGRALRKYENKAMSYIVIPVFTTNEDDFDLSNSEFYRLFSILMSLSIMDERVKHEIKACYDNSKKNNKSKIVEIIFDIDNKFKDKITGLIDKINFKIWKTFQPSFTYDESVKWVLENIVPIGIDSERKWRKYCHYQIPERPIRPIGIPKSPEYVYKNNGWDGWSQWFSKIKEKQTNWTKERCIEYAQKYKTKDEWNKKNVNSYMAAYRNGWINDCSAHMSIINKPKGYWTKEKCIEDAKKYKTQKEWVLNSGGGPISAARENGWIGECCQHMNIPKPEGYWTKEKCIESAKNYRSVTEWRIKSWGSYKSARKNNWINECSSNMRTMHHRGYWTKEKCIESAKNYKSKMEWKGKCSSGYSSAIKNKWLNECCKHMK